MSASAEYGATASIATRSMTSMALVGNRVSCIFFGIAGVLDAINTAQQDGFTVENVAMYTVEAGLWALECGAKVKAKRAPKSCKLQDAASMFITSGGTPANLRFMNSFVEGTKVLTKEGYRPIEAVRVGDLVASVDEKTGGEVYRKVVSTFNRQAPGTLSLTLEDAAGSCEVIETTPEHPFHTQGWDGKVETLVAALDGDAPAATVVPARLFPSSGKTPFGEWVKAGALKQGDSVSTSTSMVKTAVVKGGETLKAANDNGSLTVAEIVRGNRTARVYNLEVESRAGEITNNYFVGDAQAWVHNGRYIPTKVRDLTRKRITGRDGVMRCEYCGTSVVEKSGYVCSLELDHMNPYHAGGGNEPGNIAGSCRACNRGKGGKGFVRTM